jgi:epoxide hydrolase-like predicted phosphatase
VAERAEVSAGAGRAAPSRAVAFDMGGVLTHTSFGGLEDYAATLGLPAGLLTGYFRGHPQMTLLETAQITSREFFKFVCIDSERRTGIRLNIRELAAAAARGEELNPEMVELVGVVHRDCVTALLTNNVAEAGWRATFPFELFDVVLDSSQVGLRKPDPRIYQELVRRVDLPAHAVTLIDDLPENLAPAADLGIHTVLFTDAGELRHVLRRLGALGTPTTG